MINGEEQYVQSMIETQDATQALYDLACFYDQNGNRNGARYIAMQLQKRMIDPSMVAFVDEYCDFLIEKKQMIHRKLLLLCMIFSLLLSIVMFILQIHVGIIVFQFISCMIILYYALKNKMIQNFIHRQEEALKPYVHEKVWEYFH